MRRLVRLIVVPPYKRRRPVTLVKTGMENVEAPYLLFVTHSSVIDYPMLYYAIAPHGAHFICALSGVRDVGNFILSRLGCFYKRMYVTETLTIRHMRYCMTHHKEVMCVFPESHYSYDGTTSRIPDSLGKMCKLMKRPVAVLRMKGNFITVPQWNGNIWRHPPIRLELERIATEEEVQALSADELQQRVFEGLQHDDFAYQKENNIFISHPDRAKGLHYILYQCPHCGKEYEMYSEGSELFCSACNKRWELTPLGELAAKDGQTEFVRVRDWMSWQRENVRREVRGGTYRFEDEVEVHTLPHYAKFYHHGRGKFMQTPEGTRLECVAYGEKKTEVWEPRQLEGIHIEFDYPMHKRKRRDNRFGDCMEISTADDSYWLSPLHGRCRMMKLAIATEEIFLFAQERAKTK